MSATTDRANVVVSSVVEDTFPAASAERKMELVEAWERVLDNWKPSAEDIEADGEADLVAALDNMEEDIPDEEGPYAAAPVRPTTRSVSAQTGGVTSAGRVVQRGTKNPAGLDAGTLLKRLRVTLPMVKAADNDQAFNDLILNHLIAQNVRKGRPIVVPDDARVDPIPPQLFNEERRILAASRIDEYEETRAALARNRARWVSSRGTAKRSMATGMSVEQLLDGLLVLLDGAPASEEPARDVVLAAQETPVLPVAHSHLPSWASAGAVNHRTRVVTTSE